MPTAAGETPSDTLHWSGLLSDEEWTLYRRVLKPMTAQGLLFAVGGGFAFSYHSRHWRNTKDLDLYILPQDRPRAVELLERAGFKDLYPAKPYDRAWIYRGTREEVIVDLIWAMANQRAQVDEDWLKRGPESEIHDLPLRILPVEELIWAKLYAVQRDRCDWPDLLNILYIQGPALNWVHLLGRVDDDTRLLGGLLSLFCWMCPAEAAKLPAWIWEPLGLHAPAAPGHDETALHRVALLDRRDWFGPTHANDNGGTAQQKPGT